MSQTKTQLFDVSVEGPTALKNGAFDVTLGAGGNVTISDGNLVVAAGHGIDFSADGNGRAGSAATNELLADYEEGTWTPTLSGTATASAGTMTGQYMKVGNVVHAAFNLTNSTITGSHTGMISGLPYTNAGVGRAGGFGMNSFNSMSSANQTCALITENSADINLLRNVASGGWIVVGITAGSNRYLHFVCTYRAEP
jgi:hypothetical protein